MRFTQGKTTSLQYRDQYNSMQKNMHMAVTSINQYTVAKNCQNGMETPFIDQNIVTSMGINKDTLTPRYKLS
jgi:hypothetical protein